MSNNTNSHNLSTFGWNFSFIGDISLTTDKDGNVYIFNLGIEYIFSQLEGEESLSSNYSLNSQQLLQPYSSNQRIFKQQADGSYEGNGRTLTWNTDHYELEANGSKIVFRPDGQLNYVEYSNGYRLSAEYTDDLLTELKDSNENSFAINYNSDERIETVTNGAGQVNTYSYDVTGQYLLSVEDANGTTSFSYDNPFDPTIVSSITYSDGSLVSYDYDHVGRLQQVIYGEGREAISYIFNESGEITSVTDANGVQVLYEYDDNGRLISQQIAGSDQVLSYSYDSAGEVTVTDADGATVELSPSEQGLILRQSDVLGRLTQLQYDNQGNLTGINAAENFGVTYSYDERGNLVSQINPLGNEVKFTYEPNYDKLQTVIDARGNNLSYSYNEQGNLTAITYEDGSSENFTVDEQGNTVESINRRGIAIGYEYNDLGQVTRVDYQGGSADTYTYDDTGRLTSTTDASGTTLIEYDADNSNLIAKITYPTGRSLAYTYDEVGRRTQMVDQNGSEVNYSYDGLGRLASLTDETGSLIVSYTYDEAGRLAREDNGNGTYTTYTYDLAGQLLNLANYAVDDSINSSYVYTYDNLGRQISVTDLDGEWTYEYDAASQLTGAVFTSNNPEIENQDLTYVYDAAGNRIRTINNGVTTEYQTNNLNQYTSAGTVNYQYDLDGNLIYKSDGVNSWSYTYDDQDRLISVLEADGSLTEYEYDIFGNRIASVYNSERTEYLVDPFGYGDVVGEYDGNGNLTAEYTHGIGLVSRTDSSNVAAYYDFNATGSAVGLTDTGGEVLNRYAYLPYGESLFESESIVNPFEFVGQWGIMEEANGLDFMRARYYLPSEGRFLNTDPIGLAGGDTNIYRYVNNNPLNLIDPLGLWGVGLQGNAGIGVGYGQGPGIYAGGDIKAGLFANGPGVVLSGNAFDSRSTTDVIVGSEAGLGFGFFGTTADSATELAEAPASISVGLSLPFNILGLGAGIEIELSGGQSLLPIITVTGSVGWGFAASAKGNRPGGGGESLPIELPVPGLPPGRDAFDNIPGLPNLDLYGDIDPKIKFVPPPYAEDIEDRFEEAEDQVRRRYYDPLVMDLDGDGVELNSLENSNVYFDIDGDGFREKTGWVKSDDGLLVLDRNNDGYINDISELFGNQTISGFTELKELDSNNDGQITATDTNFTDLQIWRDLDEDGRSDVNELFSLTELNIIKIDTVGNRVNITKEGHLINETASFELADGTQLEVANVWMNLDQQDSYYDHKSTFNSPVVITEQILNLPNLKGYGNLPDLSIAMAKDSKLQTLVESLTENINSGDLAAARELVRPIMLTWAGIDGIDESSNNFHAFTQELEFLEKFVGRDWNNNNPSDIARETIRNTFAQLENELETRLLAQVVESSVSYNTTAERYEFSGDINGVFEQFKQVVTDSSETSNFEAVALTELIQQEAKANNWIFSEFATNEDATLEILTTDLVDTESELDPSNLSFSIVNDAVKGNAVINEAGNIEFTPAADFYGIAVFEYTVTDGVKTFTGLAQVNVSSVNDTPVANNDTAVTEEDTPVTILARELLGNDRDIDNDALRIHRVNNTVNGTANVNAEGNIEFTPDANFNGTATIEYSVTDGIDNDTATIEINVSPVNDAPLANNDTATAIDEDTSTTILKSELLANDSDIEGDSFSITNVSSDNGTAILNTDGNIEFSPQDNFNGTATINYTVSDGIDSSTASVELKINPVNDVPILTKAIPNLTLAKNTAHSDLDLAAYFDDIENGNSLNYSFQVSSSFQGGTSGQFFDDFSYNSTTKKLTLDYSEGVTGNSTITVKATDSGNESVETSFTVSLVEPVNEGQLNNDIENDNASVEDVVNPTNDMLTLVNPIPDFSVAQNATNSVIKLSDYFQNADNISYAFSLSSSIQGGTSSKFFDNFDYDPTTNSLILDYADGVIGTSNITVKATDNNSNESIETTFTVSVVDANDGTTDLTNINAVKDTITTNEDTSVTILATELLSNDLGDNLSLSSVNNFVSGTAIVNEYGNIEFTPDANFYGAAGFEYTITNGSETSTASVSVDVTAINNAPVLVKPIANLVLTQNAPNTSIQLSNHFQDVENDNNLGYSFGTSSTIQSGTSGQFFDVFSIDENRVLTLGYANDVIGKSTITVKANDGGNKFVETAFTISVINVSENGDVLLGEDGDDYLVGKQGNDTLNGGMGSDLLEGGAGKDSFIFNTPQEGGDTIVDFSVEDDTIVFSATGFGGNLTPGIVGSELFIVGTVATSNEHRFIYDAGSGDFSYDSDGAGDHKQVFLANLNNGLALTHNNLHIEL